MTDQENGANTPSEQDMSSEKTPTENVSTEKTPAEKESKNRGFQRNAKKHHRQDKHQHQHQHQEVDPSKLILLKDLKKKITN